MNPISIQLMSLVSLVYGDHPGILAIGHIEKPQRDGGLGEGT